MLGTILTILWFPMEVMWCLFGYSYSSAAVAGKSALGVSITSRASCGSTDTVALELLEEDQDFSSSSSSSSSSTTMTSCCSDAVLEQLSRALQDPSRTLTLRNLVDLCVDSRDAVVVGELLQDQQRWHSVHLEDTVEGTQYRRWNFKKTGIHRPILLQAHKNQLAVTRVTTVNVRTECWSTKAMVSLLQSLQSDLDVKNLNFTGALHYKDVEKVTLALVSLLAHDCRTWKNIYWNIAVTAADHEFREAQFVQRVCHKALQKATAERYITLYWNHHLQA